MARCLFHCFGFCVAIALLASAGAAAAEKSAAKPNIVVILSDDQGYADISHNPHHPPEVSTPHMDALCRSGVTFTSGYTTGHVCSPTRAGLMTGRYQQRFGVYTAGEGGSGVPLDETFFPQYLKPAGYVSGAFGKWHLGLTLEYNAVNRGFDEFYGFMGRGAHSYFRLAIADAEDQGSPIYRNLEPIDDSGYLTNRITEEAVSFIQRHKDRPFFAYVAYNAVHSPPEAPEEDIDKYHTDDPARNVLMAMLLHLDNGVGKIVETLKAEGLYENTLVFFLTDNGGAKNMQANNAPLRGFKGSNYEGGIRVPFAVSWPGRLPAGTVCDSPVASFDILPTALDAAGIEPPKDRRLDGRSILPLAEGKADSIHDYLFWNTGSGEWAVRDGEWKLHGIRAQMELVNLKEDIGEAENRIDSEPEIAKKLKDVYDQWLSEMAEPIKGGVKIWTPENAAKAARAARGDGEESGEPMPEAAADAPTKDEKVEAKNETAAAKEEKNATMSPERLAEREQRRTERKQEKQSAKSEARN